MAETIYKIEGPERHVALIHKTLAEAYAAEESGVSSGAFVCHHGSPDRNPDRNDQEERTWRGWSRDEVERVYRESTPQPRQLLITVAELAGGSAGESAGASDAAAGVDLREFARRLYPQFHPRTRGHRMIAGGLSGWRGS